MRASDADRERVVDVLRDAASDGRLTLEEHTDRVERAYASRTLGELKELTGDLIGQEDSAKPRRGAPQDPLPDVDARPLTAIFGEDKRTGRWVVPTRQQVTAVFGQVSLDFREAVLQSRHVVINATAVFGKVELIVPEGVNVQLNGAAVLGSKENKVRAEPAPGAPVIEVQGFILCGQIEAKTPRRRRWFK